MQGILHVQDIRNQNNLRLQFWIAIASSVLLIVKFVAYYITNSVAVLTDALESIVTLRLV